MSKNSKAVVLLSGGQDSTTALYWALNKYDKVYTITFDYGQVHRVELESSKKIAKKAGVENIVLDVTFLQKLSKNSMTDPSIKIKINENGLPSTFVPGRNMMFLSIASGWAYDKGIRNIIIGVSQVDYSGYPDCREEFINSMEKTISLATDEKFKIETPLLYLTKGEEIILLKELGHLDALKYSHTCYKGEYPPCGECPACKLREAGFKEAGFKDPIFERESI